jgi:hypothetical protein
MYVYMYVCIWQCTSVFLACACSLCKLISIFSPVNLVEVYICMYVCVCVFLNTICPFTFPLDFASFFRLAFSLYKRVPTFLSSVILLQRILFCMPFLRLLILVFFRSFIHSFIRSFVLGGFFFMTMDLWQDRRQNEWWMTPLSIHIATGCSSAFSSLFAITFMQGIYSYMSETRHIFGLYNFRAVWWLQPVLHVNIFFMINVSYSCIVLPDIRAQCPLWLFSVVPWCPFEAYCWDFVNLIWFELPLSLLISLCFCIPYALYLFCIIFCFPC